MYYILDEEGRVIGSADGPVDQTDLKSRRHFALASDLDLGVELVEAQGRGPARSIVRKSVLQPSRIELATSAKDSDGDGVPELPANGKSKTTITATLKHPSDKLVKEKVSVLFRTSAGALSRRTVISNEGIASVELTSSHETVEANVSASAEGFEPAHVVLEFVPVQKTAAK